MKEYRTSSAPLHPQVLVLFDQKVIPGPAGSSLPSSVQVGNMEDEHTATSSHTINEETKAEAGGRKEMNIYFMLTVCQH